MVKTNKILFKKTLRTVKSNYKQFLSIIIISFLAICLYTGLTANHLHLAKRVNTLYTMSNMADVYLTYQKVSDDDLDYLRTIDNVSMFSTRTIIYGNLPNDTISLLINDQNAYLNKPCLTKGEMGFLISENLAKKLNLKIGDAIEIEIPNNFINLFDENSLKILNSLVKEGKENVLLKDVININFKVTGFMYHGEGVANSSFTSAVAYTNYEYVKEAIIDLLNENYQSLVGELFATNYSKVVFANQILVKSSNPDQLIGEINNHYEGNENLILSISLDNLASNQSVMQDVEQARKLTFVFPIIFFLVSVLVILTTLSQMIYKERTLIGTMKAIGVSKGKIINHYASFGILLCLIGSVFGVIIGPMLIPQVMNIKYDLLWELPKVSQDIFHFEYLVCVIILLLLSYLVSFLACYREVNLLPVESMRVKSPKIKKFRVNSHQHNTNKQLCLNMAIRNILRNKIKSIMVVIGVLGCTSLLVCGFGIMDTLNYGIDYDFNRLIVKDITVTYSTGNNESHKNQLQSIEGIKTIEEVIYYPIKVTGKTLEDTTIYLLEENSAFFKGDYQKEGILISKELAKSLGVVKNDVVTITLNGKTTQRVIDDLFDSCVTFGIIDLASNYDDLPAPTQAWIKIDEKAHVQTILEQINEQSFVSKVYSHDEAIDNAHNLLNNIKMMTNVIKIFAILLAVVVIYNLTSLNVKERTRDIATMKVLGFNQIEISRTLAFEIMILTLLGAFIGLFFGYPILVLVLKVNVTKLLNFMFHIYFKTYLLSFLISTITAIVVISVLLSKTKKIAMVESLKSVD